MLGDTKCYGRYDNIIYIIYWLISGVIVLVVTCKIPPGLGAEINVTGESRRFRVTSNKINY